MIKVSKYRGTTSSLALGAALAAFVTLGPALANESIFNTDIVLDIRSDNAAIETLTSFGFDNFNPGTPVSDWGFMLDGVALTFQNNTTNGGGLPFGVLTKTGGIISGTATYTNGAYAITVTRQYQIVGAGSVLVTTTVQNTGQAIGNFLGYDTFDPDIGVPRSGPFSTYNDVFTDAGILIGLASDTVTTGYSVALGVTDARAVVAAGFPFQIEFPEDLTSVATAPFDGDGALADEGLHIVFSAALANGESTSFQYFLNFGTSPDGALSALYSVMTTGCSTSILADACLINSGSNQNLAIDALGGSDILQLGGAVNFTFDAGAIGTTYTNFEAVEKVGTSNVTLTGVNSFTGLTTITAGTLTVQGGSAIANTGAVTIAAAGTLALNTSETIGSLSGSGALSLGEGTILTTGDATSTVFSGVSSGPGGLSKAGTGTFTLTGAQSFSGALSVTVGTLTVTPGGSLANMSSFSVANGAFAFLGGAVQGVNGGGMTGSALGGVTVSSGGTIYLDDNTSLSGSSLTLASGSNLNLFLTTNTAVRPQIAVSGAANVAGANLGVYLDPLSFGGTTATSFTYDDVITGASAVGTFGSVALLQAPNDLFTVAATYSPTSIGLQVNRNPFSTLGGGGGNDGNVGGGLEEIFTNGATDPDLLNLINTIAGGSPSSIEDIYAAISGSENAESNGAAQRTDDPWKQSVAERVNAARTTGCTVAGDDWCLRRYAQANTGGEVMSDVQGDPTAFDWLETGIRDAGTTSVWGRVIGAWGQTYGDAFAPGSRQITGGLITGVDRVFDSLLLAGLAAQYVETAVSFDASRNSSNIQAGQLGAYVSYGGAEAYVNGNLSLIGSQAKSERFVSVGPLDYDITSVMRSWSYTASVEAGTILENDSFRFEPSFALNYQGALPDDYEERGGGGLSLLMRPEDSQSLRTIVSARLSRVFAMGDRKVVPQLRLDWRHEMLDRRQEFSAAFAGDPDVFFHVDGTAYARDTFAAGLSMTMPLTGKITGYVDAQGAFSDDSVSAMVSLGGRATW